MTNIQRQTKTRMSENVGSVRECRKLAETRSSWLNCALRGDEAVYWVSIGQQCGWYLTELSHYEAVIDVIGSVGIDDDFIY